MQVVVVVVVVTLRFSHPSWCKVAPSPAAHGMGVKSIQVW